MINRIVPIIGTFFFVTPLMYAQSVVLHPAYQSIGIEVDLPAGFDADNSTYCTIKYKPADTGTWKDAFPPDRITFSGQDQFRGSVFLLQAGTPCDIAVSIHDSIPEEKVIYQHTVSTSTLNDPETIVGTEIRWVAPDGSGKEYTKDKPGQLKTLLESGDVTCGTTIYLMDGVYTDLSIVFRLNGSCTEEKPIHIMAAPGAHPIIDGAYQGTLAWTRNEHDTLLYRSNLPPNTGYTNICILNGNNLYPYPTLNAFWYFHDHNLRDLNFNADGFVRDESNIWIKTKAGTNPNNTDVTISKAFRFITVYGNSHDGYLHFKGLTIKNIAKNQKESQSMAFDLRDVNHIWFDSCQFVFNNFDIQFGGKCDHILIENCQFKNDNGLYSHVMIKRSPLYFITEATSYARNRETGALVFKNNSNVTIRNNVFTGTNSGMYLNSSAGVAEADVYDNEFVDNYDAIECDGNWVNFRVLNNRFVRPMAGISAAPPGIGPRYFYRNVFYGMRGRENVKDDPYFVGCTPPTVYYSPATGIKTNSSGTNPARGNMYFFNNTFYSDDTLAFTMEPWLGEWKNIYFVNNIFSDNIKHPYYFHGLKDKPDFQFSSDHDNYYSYDESSPLILAKEMHGKYNCHSWFEVDSFQSQMRALTGSNRIFFNKPYHQNPAFKDVSHGDFSLEDYSPLIDGGVIIPGFYDFQGSVPDIGAIESNKSSAVYESSTPQNTFTLYPNPTTGTVYMKSRNNEIPAFVQVWNIQGINTGVEYNPGSNSIRLGTLPPGMYIVAIGQQNATILYYKILKI